MARFNMRPDRGDDQIHGKNVERLRQLEDRRRAGKALLRFDTANRRQGDSRRPGQVFLGECPLQSDFLQSHLHAMPLFASHLGWGARESMTPGWKGYECLS